MEKTLQELADYVGGTVAGDPNTIINGIMGIDEATEGHITFVSNEKYIKKMNHTKASAVIVSPKLINAKKNLLVCNNPYLAFARIVELLMFKKPVYAKGVDPATSIANTAKIGKDVSIQAYVTIGENTCIGDRVVVFPGVFIGENCTIGDDAVLHANVVIYPDTVIGRRVTIHSNTVIGSSGFGYAPDGQSYYKIPQAGNTVIEDDVDIGANTTINRATLGQTIIRRGTKIDSQVVISHNVEIGEDSVIVSQVGIAGTAKIGKHVTLAGGVGIIGHVTVGDNVTVGGRSGVAQDLPDNGTYLGTPALPIQKMRRCYVIIEKLPEMKEHMKSLDKRLKQLEEKWKNSD